MTFDCAKEGADHEEKYSCYCHCHSHQIVSIPSIYARSAPHFASLILEVPSAGCSSFGARLLASQEDFSVRPDAREGKKLLSIPRLQRARRSK